MTSFKMAAEILQNLPACQVLKIHIQFIHLALMEMHNQ